MEEGREGRGRQGKAVMGLNSQHTRLLFCKLVLSLLCHKKCSGGLINVDLGVCRNINESEFESQVLTLRLNEREIQD